MILFDASFMLRCAESSAGARALCKSEEHVELLQLDKSGIRIAAYMTELPSRRLLQKKLHEAMVLACARLQQKRLPPPYSASTPSHATTAMTVSTGGLVALCGDIGIDNNYHI